MRRYELMLVIRPDVPDDRSQTLIDRITRQIVAAGGQIVKVAPWGRRRLAYPIAHHREGSYHIILFEGPAPVVAELERGLLITEEVLRHLLVRIERPVRAARRDATGEAGDETDETDEAEGADEGDGADGAAPPATDELDVLDEVDRTVAEIDESESDAAPAAID
jgi:small subunit ribosomal protein S6